MNIKKFDSMLKVIDWQHYIQGERGVGLIIDFVSSTVTYWFDRKPKKEKVIFNISTNNSLDG